MPSFFLAHAPLVLPQPSRALVGFGGALQVGGAATRAAGEKLDNGGRVFSRRAAGLATASAFVKGFVLARRRRASGHHREPWAQADSQCHWPRHATAAGLGRSESPAARTALRCTAGKESAAFAIVLCKYIEKNFTNAGAPEAHVDLMSCPQCRAASQLAVKFGAKLPQCTERAVQYRCRKCDVRGEVHVALQNGPGAMPADRAAPPLATPEPRGPPPRTRTEARSSTTQPHAGYPPRAPHLERAYGVLEPLSDEAFAYLTESRRLSAEVLQRNHVCQLRRGSRIDSLVFPYVVQGNVINEKMRSLKKKGFFSTRGGERSLYGVDDIRDAEEVVLVEGEIDKLSVESAGIRTVASVPNGAGVKVPESYGAKAFVQRARKVFIATDMDSAGNKCAQTIADFVGRPGRCFRVTWRNGCKDANEVLTKYGPEAVREDIHAAEPWGKPVGLPVWDEAWDSVEARLALRNRVPLSTGWKSLDYFFKVVPGEFTVVTGEPGSGKSEWLYSLAMNLAKDHGWHFLVCAFEATGRTLAAQMIEKQTGVPIKDMTDKLNDNKRAEAWDWSDQHFRYTGVDNESPTMADVLDEARTLGERDMGLQGLIIDPYNYLARAGKQLETTEISTTLAQVKRFAEETNCHVIIVAHPTKNGTWVDKKPSGYDIAGSAHWNNKADNVIVVSRLPAHDGEDAPPGSSVEIRIEKVRNRDAGQLGEVELVFDPKSRSYHEADHKVREQVPSMVPDEHRFD